MRIKLADGTWKTLDDAQLARGFTYEARTGTHELRLERKGPRLSLVDTFTPSTDAASALAGHAVEPLQPVVQSSAPVMGGLEVMPQSWFDSEAFGEEFAWSHWEATVQDDGGLEYRWKGPELPEPGVGDDLAGWTTHPEPADAAELEPEPVNTAVFTTTGDTAEPGGIQPIVLLEEPEPVTTEVAGSSQEPTPAPALEPSRPVRPPKLPKAPTEAKAVSEAALEEALTPLREEVSKAQAALEKAEAALEAARAGFDGKRAALGSVIEDVEALRAKKRQVGQLAGGVPALVAASVMQAWSDDGRIAAGRAIQAEGRSRGAELEASLSDQLQGLAELRGRLAEVTAQLERPRGFKVRGSVNADGGGLSGLGDLQRDVERSKVLLAEQRDLMVELQGVTRALAGEYDLASNALTELSAQAERLVEVSQEGLTELLGLASGPSAEADADRWLQKRTNRRSRAELEDTARQWMKKEGAQRLSGEALRTALQNLT